MVVKLAVSGTRDGYLAVESYLDEWVHDNGAPELVLVGDADGVDAQVRRWARRHGYPLRVFEAEWERYGRFDAGHRRNQAIVDALDPGDHLVAFPGRGNGTHDCMRRVRARGDVWVLEYPTIE